MRLYAYPEAALIWAEGCPETLGWMSRIRACFPIPEKRVVVPLIEKAGSTSLFWALLERWRPEEHRKAVEDVERARIAGDAFGQKAVRDIVQREVCVHSPAETAGWGMVAMMRDPVERFWSAWKDKSWNPYGKAAVFRRNIPRQAEPWEIVEWLMYEDPGRVDEHFAPQWTTLAPGAEVHAMTPAGIAVLEERLEIVLPWRNRGQRERVPMAAALEETVRWLLAMDCQIYASAAAADDTPAEA